MTTITIRHTRAEGTLVYGTTKGDGAGPVLKTRWFRPSRNLPEGASWFLPHSRDRAANKLRINEAANALRETGFNVEIAINDTTPGRSFAEAEQERYERAEQRADQYNDYADAATDRARSHEAAYQQMAQNWPLGQPIINEQTRRVHQRMTGAGDRARREGDKADHWDERAAIAERYRAHRENVPTTLRRIEKLEAEKRRLERALEGPTRILAHDTEPPEGAVTLEDTAYGPLYRLVPVGEHRARLEADIAQVNEELAYWCDHISQAQQRGIKIWSKDDFTPGDFVKTNGTWVEVLRVNAKSLTIPWAHLWVGRTLYTRTEAKNSDHARRNDGKYYTDRLPYDKVTGRASAAEIHEMFPEHP